MMLEGDLIRIDEDISFPVFSCLPCIHFARSPQIYIEKSNKSERGIFQKYYNI